MPKYESAKILEFLNSNMHLALIKGSYKYPKRYCYHVHMKPLLGQIMKKNEYQSRRL